MTKTEILLLMGLIALVSFLLIMLVWSVWVRTYLKRSDVPTAEPFNLAAPIIDLATVHRYGHGHMIWSAKILGALLFLFASDILLMLVIIFF